MEKLTKNEKLTLIIAILALIISLVNSYFQYFHISNKLLAKIVDDNITTKDKNSISVTVSLVNCGNQPALVKGAQLIFITDESKHSFEFGSGAWETKGVPVIIKPGEIYLIIAKSQFSLTRHQYKAKETDLERTFRVGIHFSSMDSQGEVFDRIFIFKNFSIKKKDEGVMIKSSIKDDDSKVVDYPYPSTFLRSEKVINLLK